jgi:hypothetical protein
MSMYLHNQGSAHRSSYLYYDSDPNQSSVPVATILASKRAALELTTLRLDFTASASAGDRYLRLQVRDADGEVRHSRELGVFAATGTFLAAIPFAFPFQFTDVDGGYVPGEKIVKAMPNVGGTVNATVAATNLTVTLLDTYYPLYAEAAPAAYPVAYGTRVYDVSSVVVKDSTDTTTYIEGTDYDVDYAMGKIRAKTGGNISATDDLVVDFSYAKIEYAPVAKPGSVDPLRLPTGWTVVVEDYKDVDSTSDSIEVWFYGKLL